MTTDVAAFAAAAAAGTLTDRDADRWLLHVTAPKTSTVPGCPHTPPCPAADVLGADLHPGSVVVDLAGEGHRIDHLKPYPGAFLGDHARRAYEHADEHGWQATVGDHEHFYVREEAV